ATGSRDRTARVWDLATGEPALPPMCHTGTVGTVRFDPDGRRLLTVSQSLACLWELTTANPAPVALRAGGRVSGVACSADGRFALTLREPREVPAGAQVWDTSTGKLVQESPREAQGARVAGLSPDGRAAVTVNGPPGENVAHVWDVKSGRLSA